MIIVGVGDDDRVQASGVKREASVRAVRVDPVRVKEATIEQNFVGANFQKVGAARDLPRRTVERDTQPTVLPSRGPKSTAPPRTPAGRV